MISTIQTIRNKMLQVKKCSKLRIHIACPPKCINPHPIHTAPWDKGAPAIHSQKQTNKRVSESWCETHKNTIKQESASQNKTIKVSQKAVNRLNKILTVKLSNFR